MQLRFLPFLIAALAGCQSGPQTCKYKPSAVFEAHQPGVKAYNFEVQGQQSLESVLLETGTLLEIHQQVCDQTRQEYRFIVKGDFSGIADSSWMKEATRELVYLSTLSPKQHALRAWADIIETNRATMRLGEDKVVQPGISVRVDKVLSPEQGTLLVVFSQE
ncbi:MAG TPA: hypothetical protein PK971_16385 [Saprospiraceae bacterium]|nr:hypothetical protein [Saprospiraceae bacterium]